MTDIPYDEELMRELLQTFQAEAADHLETLNSTLLTLERTPEADQNTDLIQEAFRTAHSLKGAARAVSLTDVEHIAHRVEDVLKQARDGQRRLDADTCDVLYDALDGIQGVLDNNPPDMPVLLHKLEALLPDVTADPAPQATPETPETPKRPNGAHTFQDSSDETIRVAVSKLDALMAQAGELVVTRISAEQRATDMQLLRRRMLRVPRLWQDVKTRLGRLDSNDDRTRYLIETLSHYHEAVEMLLNDVTRVDSAITRDALRLGIVTEQIQDDMRRVRMVPFHTLDALLQRVTRDVARSQQKQVALTVKGGEVELDKKVLEMMKDPLLHLLRNAVIHGIEAPDVRVAAGKPAEGQIVIRIRQRGSEAHISITDDGQGFQQDALREAYEARGQTVSDETDVVSLAFLPGMTTAPQVTELAGRGVGLDVVRQQIDTLQGRIYVETTAGSGSRLQMVIPVSLAMTRVLLVQAAQRQYALPLAAVDKIIAPRDAFSVEGRAMLPVDKKPLPLVALSDLLGSDSPPEAGAMAIIVGAGGERIALMVDDVLTEQELAVKPFGLPVVRVPYLAGAALLGNGEPVVVLNASDIVKGGRGIRITRVQNPVAPSNGHVNNEPVAPDTILVVDDSITTRTLEKNILQAAGYHVVTATDGLEALRALRSHDVKLVVADVEMPNMDGITLTRSIRESDNHAALPVILVTSLENPEDRERGMVAGANAYIVKRGFNQAELLTIIQQYV